MNLEEVIKILKDQNNSKELYFFEKNNDEYIAVCPEASEEIFDIIINNAIEVMSKKGQDEWIHYNPVGVRDGTVEICNVDYVGNYAEVVNSLVPQHIEVDSERIDKFSFYCVNIVKDDKVVRLFRRLTKFKKISSHGFLGLFQGKVFNRVDSKVLGIDGDIDLVVYDDEIMVLNHISLERIFKIEEQYEKKSKETIECLRNTGKIENFDSFKEDCLNSLSTRKILTKMQNEGNDLSKCLDNFDNIVKTINIFELPINVNNNSKSIIYESKEQIVDILRLARDSYYTSLVQEKPGIDNKI